MNRKLIVLQRLMENSGDAALLEYMQIDTLWVEDDKKEVEYNYNIVLLIDPMISGEDQAASRWGLESSDVQALVLIK